MPPKPKKQEVPEAPVTEAPKPVVIERRFAVHPAGTIAPVTSYSAPVAGSHRPFGIYAKRLDDWRSDNVERHTFYKVEVHCLNLQDMSLMVTESSKLCPYCQCGYGKLTRHSELLCAEFSRPLPKELHHV